MSADGYVLINFGESNADACLDVVFVHGITGDPLTTWGASEPELGWPSNQIHTEVDIPLRLTPSRH
jgi:hypothetical protein